MTMTPADVLYAVLAFSWLEFAFEAYLGRRQRRIYASTLRVPAELSSIMDGETFEKARLYALDKSNFGAVESIFSQVSYSI